MPKQHIIGQLTPAELRSRLSAAGWSGVILAQHLGIDASNVWRWRIGTRPIPACHMPAILEALSSPPPPRTAPAWRPPASFGPSRSKGAGDRKARRRRRARIEARFTEKRQIDPVAVDRQLAPTEQRAIERVRTRPPEPVERDPDDPPTLLDTIAALLRPITDMASGTNPAEASVAPVTSIPVASPARPSASRRSTPPAPPGFCAFPVFGESVCGLPAIPGQRFCAGHIAAAGHHPGAVR